MVKKREEKGKRTKELETDTLPKGYDPEQVRSGVKALFSALEKDNSKKKSLFSSEGDFVIIQVSCVRIPKVTRKNYRFPLPHGYLRDTSEVCLFVRNLQGSKDLEYEDTVRHYKDLLSEAGVTSVHEVISVNQLKQEYKTYEMKRRLAARFDFFLGDAVVNDWLNGLVGKNFHRCKKIPNPVKLDVPCLKDEIDRALHKTTMVVTGCGDNYSAKVGNTQQPLRQVCENIDAFVKGLMEKFPGKWGNVRALHVGVPSGISIPIYVAVVIPNSIKIPKVKLRPENRKRPVDVGELSTLPDDYKVIVLPDGTVKVKKPQKTQANEEKEVLINEEEEFFDEDEVSDMDDEEDDDEVMSDSKEIEVKQEEEEAVDSESEEDSGVEAAEEAYLQELKVKKEESNQAKKKRKGEEDTTTLTKIQKKMKLEDSLKSKIDQKKVKGSKVEKSLETAKVKDTSEVKTLPVGKTLKKRKTVPLPMQWQVEELEDKPMKQKESKVKTDVRVKKEGKSSVSASVATSKTKVEVKQEVVESVTKQATKKCKTDPISGAVNGKMKKGSKPGKVKKG